MGPGLAGMDICTWKRRRAASVASTFSLTGVCACSGRETSARGATAEIRIPSILCYLRRVLCVLELHRTIVLGGVRSRSEGAAHHHRLVVEDLCHDRLATGLCTGACAHHQRDDKDAKPEEFEPNLDRAVVG